MKKKWGKKLVVAMLATVCVVTAVGCGKKETKADYQNTYDPSEFASASYHAGYMGSLCPEDSDASYTASVSFKDDQYVLTKEIVGPTTQVVGHNVDIDVKYVFSGSYTQDGDKYTLKAPEKCEWSEDWADLSSEELAAQTGFKDGEGTATSESDTNAVGDEILSLFNGEFIQTSSDGAKDQVVELKDGKILFE